MGVIVLVADEFPPSVGGVGRSVARIARGLAASRLAVCVAVLERELGDVPQTTADYHGVPVFRFFPLPTGSDRAQSRDAERGLRVLEGFRGQTIDLVHAFFPTTTGMVAGLLARTTGAAFLASFRGNDIYEAIHGRHLGNLRWVLRHADFVTFVNQEMADLAKAVEPACRRGEVIRNGVPRLAPVALRGELAPPVVLGTTGIMRSKKGLRVLLLAAAQLRARLDFKLVIVGGLAANEEPYWREQLSVLDLERLVEITGLLPHEEVAPHLARLDLYLHPAIYDGCPNALLEAASAGLPIVCARSGATSDLFVDRQDCLMHGCDDADGLADAVVELAGSPALREKLGAAARRRMTEACTLEQEQRAWQRVYGRLLDGRTSAGSRP
jgi:glycosyltransferase involved in cell wall biosynthesis